MPPDEISRSLGRLEGKMDQTLDAITDLKATVLVNHNRITSLEKTRSWLHGYVLALSVVVTIGFEVLKAKLRAVFQ